MTKTYKIIVTGQVQGVGFRPYVYSLASEFNLKGTVSNNEQGVLIIATGNPKSIHQFYQKLVNFPPPVSNINHHEILAVETIFFNDFQIVTSHKNGQINLPLTPDFAICNTCKSEIKNTKNKRYNYAFTTCVHCGPRYAITEKFPFERSHTSMHHFFMCDSCIHEYKSPSNRRFHSQTNTCNFCGIQLTLKNNKGEIIQTTPNNIFKTIATLLLNSKIIAIKNTSGYLLCCNAQDKTVIKKLRQLKNRPKKPFAVLYPSLNLLQKEFLLNQSQIKTLTAPESPITIISSKNYSGNLALQEIAPQLNQIGIMLPYTGILELLASAINLPIIATSGNIHGCPIINKNKDAFEQLNNIADYFLQHNLKIKHPQDDSVVKFSSKENQKIIFRRSRGYAPNYLNATLNSTEKIMALGADLKSSIAFYPNNFLYVSQYLGNLENYNVYERFVLTSQAFINLFEQKPSVILADKHPQYHSVQYSKELAKQTNAQQIKIQHHKAHFAAILGEHQLFNQRVLGVIFDGTGYGDDTQIWGGEFFTYEQHCINRVHHLTYFDWLLGDKMAKEPRLSLFALASDELIPVLQQKFTENELKTYHYIKNNNTLKTSSIGRLFDAVASLLNITDINSYEGEAAILLENLIGKYHLNSCTNYINSEEFSATEIILNCYSDLKKGVSVEQIAINFLYTLANKIISFAKTNNYVHVALSGGVFQNSTLVDMLFELAPTNLKLYFHSKLSPNDENISFGQIQYYLNIKN